MDPLILHMADGSSFFAGLAVVGFADVLLLCLGIRSQHARLLRSSLTVLALVGVALVVLSATPLSLSIYLLWAVPAIGALVLGNMAKPPRRSRYIAGALVVAATAGIALVEAPYRALPSMAVCPGQPLFVLGDSLSAGMGTGERCWPDVLRDTTGLPVVNLAEPGATVKSATRQAAGIPRPGAVVIIEIGGNDLLGGTNTAAFEAELDSLVQGLRSSHHDILMFELPLFPFRNGYGMAQRQVAAKYGVTLLPKRCLTSVLGQEGSTLDGLHFSQEGHNAMAEIVAKVLKK